MRLLGVGERIGLVDFYLDVAGLHHIEQRAGKLVQPGPVANMREESRPGCIERTFLRQQSHIDVRQRARSLAESR